jgi:hypothetical protein
LGLWVRVEGSGIGVLSLVFRVLDYGFYSNRAPVFSSDIRIWHSKKYDLSRVR